MKKLSALILAAAMCVGLLAGCGSSDKPSGSTPSGNKSANASGSWPSGTVTLLCGFGAGGSSDLESSSPYSVCPLALSAAIAVSPGQSSVK